MGFQQAIVKYGLDKFLILDLLKYGRRRDTEKDLIHVDTVMKVILDVEPFTKGEHVLIVSGERSELISAKGLGESIGLEYALLPVFIDNVAYHEKSKAERKELGKWLDERFVELSEAEKETLKSSLNQEIAENERKCIWVTRGWDDETGEIDDSWFQGQYSPHDFGEMATLKILKDDVAKQKQEVEDDTHPDGYVIPWGTKGEVLFVQDGVFIWDEELDDYKQVYVKSLSKKRYYDDNYIEGYKNSEAIFAVIEENIGGKE